MALRYSCILFLLIIGMNANSQSFLKRVPKPEMRYNIIADSVVSIKPSAKMLFRPVLNVASYAFPDNSLLNGLGVSYQRLKWDKNKWVCQWSINGLLWSKTSLTGGKNTGAFGGAIGLFNNLLLIGGATDFKNGFGTVGIGVNLNN